MQRNLALIAFAGMASVASANFSYSDFSALTDLQLNGTAHQVGNVVRMTDDGIGDQAGNMWHTNRQSVGSGFTTTFQFRCDGVGSDPADGMALGLQADSVDALGNGGGDNAMANLPGSVVVNFQSFWNKVQFIATDTNGSGVAFTEVEFSGLHRSDPWTAVVNYDAGTQGWEVWLDSSLVLATSFDLESAVGDSDAYLGLGAGTGLGFDNNDVLSWNADVVPEPFSLVTMGLGVVALARLRRK